jgi:predicted site-specific integrase-resolvase
MVKAGKRVALYCRVSTKDKGQTTENQRRALEQWAANAGCTVVATFEDKVSGAKGRDKRPQFDALLKAAVRREFDMIAVWSSDRLGRSMSHLIEVLETIKGTGVGLYIHTQALDTTTPAGRAMLEMLGVFAERSSPSNVANRHLRRGSASQGLPCAQIEGARAYRARCGARDRTPIRIGPNRVCENAAGKNRAGRLRRTPRARRR